MDIGGCAVGALDRRGWRTVLGRAIESGTPHHHLSLNAAKWMRMTTDPLLRRAAREATSVGADGASVLLAARLSGTPLPARVPGCDLAGDLLEDAATRGWRVALLGGTSEVVAEVARRERDRGVRVVWEHHGYFGSQEEGEIANAIRDARPDLLLVAMGTPRTEHFVVRRQDMLRVPLVLGVGGTFDILAGRVRRAPALLGKIGLEGVWRLAGAPRQRFRSAVLDPPAFLLLAARLRQVGLREAPYRVRQLGRRVVESTRRRPHHTGGDREWHDDPSGRGRWPDRPAASVSVVGGPLDPRPLWERARLQREAERAEADRADPEPLRRVRSFLHSCPVGWGVHWTSAAEVAFRLASLARIAKVHGAADVRDAVAAHARWIVAHPSLYGSENNHRVAELAALAVAGHTQAAQDELPRVFAAQIHPDGGGVEQSVAYLAQVLEWGLLARRCGVRGLGEPLLRGARFLAALTDASGRCPTIGDDDGGRLEIEAAGDRYPGAVAKVVLAELGATVVPDTCCFPDTGLSVLRDGGHLVAFDHGPLGSGLGAHGHADALACWVHLHGRPVIVSRGTGVYQGDPTLRAFGRGTASHPTLVVAGADQSVPHVHPFLWRTRANAWREELHAASRTVSAAHDGYRSRLGVIHRRTVSLTSGEVVWIDRLDGARSHHVQIVLPLAPDLGVESAGRDVVIREGTAPIARVVAPAGMTVRVVRGGPRPSVGWHAVAYGTLVEANAVLVEGLAAPGRAIRTVIALV